MPVKGRCSGRVDWPIAIVPILSTLVHLDQMQTFGRLISDGGRGGGVAGYVALVVIDAAWERGHNKPCKFLGSTKLTCGLVRNVRWTGLQ